MSYLEDSIDWQAIEYIDRWLDENVGDDYKDQPLAQDWARVSKVIEELGEAIQKLILFTGQNPRKISENQELDRAEFIGELMDTAITALLAAMHFTKSTFTVRQALRTKVGRIEARAIEDTRKRYGVMYPKLIPADTEVTTES